MHRASCVAEPELRPGGSLNGLAWKLVDVEDLRRRAPEEHMRNAWLQVHACGLHLHLPANSYSVSTPSCW